MSWKSTTILGQNATWQVYANIGNQGASGATGFQGASGSTGIFGASGLTGATGATGFQGASGSTGLTGATGLITIWTTLSGATGIVSGTRYIANTTSGPFSVSLPASPTTGYAIEIQDGASFFTNNLTLLRNGSTIQGGANDLVLSIDQIFVRLVYDGSTWRVSANLGPIGVQGASGATGFQGASGATGFQGASGSTGLSGVMGASGSTGPQGSQGVVGTTGATGVQGASGSTGPAVTTQTNAIIGALAATGATGTITVQLGLVVGGGAGYLIGATGYFGATGLVYDVKGDLRSAPQNAQAAASSTYTLVRSDAGKHIYITGTSTGVTVPIDTFNAGDMIMIANGLASNATIVTNAVTAYLSGTATSTSPRTLAQKGIATILCVSGATGSNTFLISGAGLT